MTPNPLRVRVADKPRGDALDTYPEGRRCETKGCNTKLSIYNSKRRCRPCESKGLRGVQPNPLTGGQVKKM